VEGRFREEMFREGKYKDRLWMGLLRSAYDSSKSGGRKKRQAES
jgi:RimJ/RimL family protein N-acetyltransferase